MEYIIEHHQHNTGDKKEVVRQKLTDGTWQHDDIIILNPYEMEFYSGQWFDYSKIIAKTYKELNSGACNSRYPDLKPGHEVIQWPLFWLWQTYCNLNNHIRMPDTFPTKLFCSMNGRVRPNRDALWGQLVHHHILNQYCSYIGKGVTVDLLDIDELSWEDTQRSHGFPPFYKDILIDLVCETHTSNLFFTEKTWKPFLAERIPLFVTAPGAYQQLRDWGFEDYTELFDYGFDKKLNLEDRIEDIIGQLKVKLEVDDPKQLYQLTKEKREHNRENCLRLIEQEDIPALAYTDSNCLRALLYTAEKKPEHTREYIQAPIISS